MKERRLMFIIFYLVVFSEQDIQTILLPSVNMLL